MISSSFSTWLHALVDRSDHQSLPHFCLSKRFKNYACRRQRFIIIIIIIAITSIKIINKLYLQAATLRVLSYTSPSFEQLCQPRMLRQVENMSLWFAQYRSLLGWVRNGKLLEMIDPMKKHSLKCDRDHLTILWYLRKVGHIIEATLHWTGVAISHGYCNYLYDVTNVIFWN